MVTRSGTPCVRHWTHPVGVQVDDYPKKFLVFSAAVGRMLSCGLFGKEFLVRCQNQSILRGQSNPGYESIMVSDIDVAAHQDRKEHWGKS
jgi:hypothetical protein